MTTKISVRDCLSFGWETFKKNPLVYVAAVALIDVFSFGSEYLTNSHLLPSNALGYSFIALINLASIAVFMIVMTNFVLRAHDAPDTVGYGDIFRPRHLLKLLGVLVLSAIAIVLGLVALVIPGLILIAALSFAGYIAVDKNRGPIASMKESFLLSKGNRFKLFVLFIVTMASAILYGVASVLLPEPFSSFIQFLADIIVLPVTGIAMVHAYRLLEAAQMPVVIAE